MYIICEIHTNYVIGNIMPEQLENRFRAAFLNLSFYFSTAF